MIHEELRRISRGKTFITHSMVEQAEFDDDLNRQLDGLGSTHYTDMLNYYRQSWISADPRGMSACFGNDSLAAAQQGSWRQHSGSSHTYIGSGLLGLTPHC
jgi:hypothetical protein